MKRRLTAALVVASAVSLPLVADAGAALIGVYRNTMESSAQHGQILKLSGERCGRGGSSNAFRIEVGKRTKECLYRTPVIGRDLEISVRERLLSDTPRPLRQKSFLAVSLRTGGAAAGYQLAVFPMQRKAQLLKRFSDGRTKFLAIEKDVRSIKGIDKANDLRLRAFNVTGGPNKGECRVLAFVGGELVADVTDEAAGDLEGRASGFSIGATTSAKGLVGSVDDVVIRVPDPFH